MADEREAEVLMQVDDVVAHLVEGETHTVLEQGALVVLLATVSKEEEELSAAEFSEMQDESGRLCIMVIGDNVSIPIAKHIPTLRSDVGTYLVAASDGKFFGLSFPSLNEEERDTFESVLAEYSSFKISGEDGQILVVTEDVDGESAAAPSGSSKRDQKVVAGAGKVSTGLEKGSQLFAAGIRKGATMGVKGIRSTSKFLKSKLKKKEKAVEVSASTQAKADKARMMTRSFVSVTNGLVSGVVAMSSAMAKSLADSIGETDMGKKIKCGNSGPKAKAAKQVAFSAFGAVSTVYDAMHDASKILLSEAGNAGAEVVGHRYGDDAEKFTRTAGGAVGDVGKGVMNVKHIGVKSVAKATVKKTAVEVAKSEEEKEKDKEEGTDDPAVAMMKGMMK